MQKTHLFVVAAMVVSFGMFGTMAANAETYYNSGNNEISGSSLETNSGAGWVDADGEKVSGHPAAGNAYIINKDSTIRTLPSGSTVFAGDSLSMITGTIMFKGCSVTIPKFIVPSGTAKFTGGTDGSSYVVNGACEISEGATLDVRTQANSGKYRNFAFGMEFSGNGLLLLETAQNSVKSTVTFTGSLSGFTGRISAQGNSSQIVEIGSESSYPADTLSEDFSGISLSSGSDLRLLASGTIGPNRGLYLGDSGSARPEVYVEEGETVTVSGSLGGAVGFVKTGGGSLVLSGGMIAGTITVNEGSVIVGDSVADFPNATFVENGGTVVSTDKKLFFTDCGVNWVKAVFANGLGQTVERVEAKIGDESWTVIGKHVKSESEIRWVFAGLDPATRYTLEMRGVLAGGVTTNLGTVVATTLQEDLLFTSQANDVSSSTLFEKGNGWLDNSGATVTGVNPSGDYVLKHSLRTLSNADVQMFGGHAAILSDGGVLNLKVQSPGNVTFNSLICQGGSVAMSWKIADAGNDFTYGQMIGGDVYIPAGAFLSAGGGGDGRLVSFIGDVHGAGCLCVNGQGASSDALPNGVNLAGDNSNFFGVITNADNNHVGFISAKAWPGDFDMPGDGLVFKKSSRLLFGASMECNTPNRIIAFGATTPDVHANEGVTVKMNSPFSGTKGFNKTGPGALVLRNQNTTISGTILVSDGAIGWENPDVFGSAVLKFGTDGGIYVTTGTQVKDFTSVPAGFGRLFFDFGDQLPTSGTVLTVPESESLELDDANVRVACSHPRFHRNQFRVRVKTEGGRKLLVYDYVRMGLVIMFQ